MTSSSSPEARKEEAFSDRIDRPRLANQRVQMRQVIYPLADSSQEFPFGKLSLAEETRLTVHARVGGGGGGEGKRKRSGR